MVKKIKNSKECIIPFYSWVTHLDPTCIYINISDDNHYFRTLEYLFFFDQKKKRIFVLLDNQFMRAHI